MLQLYNLQSKKFILIILAMLVLAIITYLIKHFYPIPIYEEPKFSGEFKPIFYKPETSLADISKPLPPRRNLFASLSSVEQQSKTHKSNSSIPVLKGISHNNDKRNAIIELNGEIKALKLSEHIGSYQLIEITDNTVTVISNGRKLHLRIGGNNK